MTIRHTSEDIRRALFKTAPKRKTLAQLKAGRARYIKKKRARSIQR